MKDIYEIKEIKLLKEAEYNGLKYFIIFNGNKHPCAYLEIPKGHKLYEKEYDDLDIDCHWGLSYSDYTIYKISDKKEMWYLGWDYGHSGDYSGYYNVARSFCEANYMNVGKKWTVEEIEIECKNVIDQINNLCIDHNKILNEVMEEIEEDAEEDIPYEAIAPPPDEY